MEGPASSKPAAEMKWDVEKPMVRGLPREEALILPSLGLSQGCGLSHTSH